MTISFVAAAAGEDVGTGGQVAIPSAVAAGHRLLAIVETNANSGQSHGTPPGWILVATSQGSADGGSQFASLFTKVANADDHDSVVDFPVSPTGTKDPVAVVAYAGSVTTPVIAASGVLAHTGVAATSIDVPIINVPEVPATLVAAASKKGGTVEISMTQPASFTFRVKAFATGGGACACAFADGAAGGTGNTSVADWATDASSANATSFLVALTEGTPPPLIAPVFRRLIDADTGEWFPAL